MVKQIQGIAASNGIAIAKAYQLNEPELTYKNKHTENPEQDLERLIKALNISKEDLDKIREHTEQALGKEHAEIFSAHLLILNDPEYINPIKDKINKEMASAEAALESVTNMFVDIFKNMDNAYMRERAADLQDVAKRVMAHLLNIPLPDLALIDEEVIIVAHDLTPSDTAQLNRKYVKGFITDVGGRTSHSAIMARSLEIPAVVGTKNITSTVKQGEPVIIDGTEGKIITQVDEETKNIYQQKLKDFKKQQQLWVKLKDEPTRTKDKIQVELSGNIGTPRDVGSVLENGGEGIGLYRTEFLFMGQAEMPTEDMQFEAYKSVLEMMEDKPVIVRTLDIGGDKDVDYLDLPKEMNPFLGFRAIRFCLANEAMFRTQLRALLRSSIHGNLKIMFPMVATLEEFRQAKQLLLEEKENLQKEEIDVADNIEVGIMVEIPSTAILANQFAKEVDFFSIGTNDLIQYTMAADRMNEHVSYLYQPYHPAILNLVHQVIQAAHREGKWVGMCGEMAGDPVAIPILLGLGLDEFSMSASSILPARSQISTLSKQEMEELARTVLKMGTAEEVKKLVKEKTPRSF